MAVLQRNHIKSTYRRRVREYAVGNLDMEFAATNRG